MDTEGSYGNLLPWQPGNYLTNICLIYNDEEPVVLYNFHDTEEPEPRFFERIQEYIDKSDIVAAHNMKYDMNVLKYHGVNFDNVKVYCTMVAEYLLSGQDTQERSFGLSDVSEWYGGTRKIDVVKQLWDMGFETSAIPRETLDEYVIDDTTKVKEIYACQQPLIDKEGMRPLVELQCEYIHSLSDMELNGIKWDVNRALAITTEYTELVTKIENEILELVGDKRLNVSSNQHLSAMLFGGTAKIETTEWVIKELKVRPESRYYERTVTEEIDVSGLGFHPDPRTETKTPGVYAVDKDNISYLKAKTPAQKKVKKLLAARSGAAKVLSTVAGKKGDAGLSAKVMPDGLIHPSFNQTVARTGRLTSSDPNGQNLPRGSTSPIKESIVPRNDGILQWDLSQIEWRAAAVLSDDPIMLHEINNLIDQHIAACVELMELPFKDKSDPESKKNRTNAKIFNFRINKIVLTKPCEFREHLRAAA